MSSIFNALTCLFRPYASRIYIFSLLFCHFVFHFSCFICSALFTCTIAPCIPPFDDTRQVHISYGYTDRISLNKLKIIVWHHVSDFLFWSNSEIKWKILNTHATYSTHTAQLAMTRWFLTSIKPTKAIVLRAEMDE